MTRRELLKWLGQGVCTTALGGAAAAQTGAVGRNVNVSSQPLAGAQPSARSGAEMAVSSARAVLTRLLGSRADEFDLEWIPAAQSHPVYSLSASDGRVRVKGSSGVAISRGAYDYLRSHCNLMVTWSGKHVDLPGRLPDVAERHVVCPYQFTQYLNVVTFGYTAAFWNWERWQKELDWMALHGITMALALVGQEAVWQRMWTAMGITQAELNRSSCGPAYLPWHWMGNINNFDGPMPQAWIAQQADLQKQILRRMRELGITPVAPAFSGFVPEGFKRICPEARLSTVLWAGQGSIPRNTRVFMLHPDEADLYKEIGRHFIQEYTREFGEVDYYLADLFNELEPPVDEAHRYQQLKSYAFNVYVGILAGNPNGTWVMQGWLFFADPKFWDSDSIRAYLSGIPDERTIIIDYTSDLTGRSSRQPVWATSDAYFGRQWMNGMIHNFGGNNNVRADLVMIAQQPAAVLNSPKRGKLVGWALCPEGVETNELAFELMTDVGWSHAEIDLRSWIPAYCRARYGDFPAAMEQAFELLQQSVYSPNSGPWAAHFLWQRRPQLDAEPAYAPDDVRFEKAVDLFLSCAPQLGTNELYRNDLIELVTQCAAVRVDEHLVEACRAHRAGDAEARDRLGKESLDLITRMDALLNLHPNRRLQPWVEAARSHAAAPDELSYYDCEARRLLTYWGWNELNDYAARVWSGLMRDYYVGRWQLFFRDLSDKHAVAMDDFEQGWLSFPYVASPVAAVTNPATEAAGMLKTTKEWQ